MKYTNYGPGDSATWGMCTSPLDPRAPDPIEFGENEIYQAQIELLDEEMLSDPETKFQEAIRNSDCFLLDRIWKAYRSGDRKEIGQLVMEMFDEHLLPSEEEAEEKLFNEL